jgi:PII-like signaling protein
MMGKYLKFYVHENRRHHSILLYEWLLEQAKHLGIPGGSAFRSIAGFGRLGVINEEHFFELAGDLAVEVVFAVSNEEADRLLDLVRAENLALFYTKMSIEYGVANGNAEPPDG